MWEAGKWMFEKKKKNKQKNSGSNASGVLQSSKIMRRHICQKHGIKQKTQVKKEHVGKCQNSPVGHNNTSEEMWVTVFMSQRARYSLTLWAICLMLL